MKRLTCILLTICLLAAMAACGNTAPQPPYEPPQPPRGDGPDPLPDGALKDLRAASSYTEVYSVLQTSLFQNWNDGGFWIAEDAAAPEAPMAPSTSRADTDGHSQTNVQVAGIDEGDIVKTDGSYIYVLRGHELIIFRADGAATAEVWRKTVGVSERQEHDGDKYAGVTGAEKNPLELYVSGDRLAVVCSYAYWNESADADGHWNHVYEDRLETELLDISDPTQPRTLTSLAQDGGYLASRLTSDTLYLVSRYWINNETDEHDPDSFVPALYRDGAAEILPAERIWLPNQPSGAAYTVVTAYALQDGAQQAALSLLGAGSTVYMSQDDLYLAWQNSGETVSEPRRDGVYTVTEHSYSASTELVRISLADGSLRVAANGSVDGNLLNQFALDAHDGYLRLVTTTSGNSYTVYEDEQMGFVNYVWPDETQRDTNNLFVLDSALNVVGSITGLAEDERVYSVRFAGEIGYFVTFRQTDPLFAVDLSDPTAPTLLSALKIPGFSQYLHVYGEGRLFGLGMDADAQTGRTQTMKLSMFDTSDPAKVTEKHTLVLDAYWSAALHNHKAILIAPEKDIIAFPSESGYVIYGYSDAQGFYLRAELKDTDAVGWYGNARGLYIGQYAYVVGETQIWVMDLEQLMLTQTLSF